MAVRPHTAAASAVAALTLLMGADAAASAVSRRLKGVPMDGECAKLAHHDSWEDDATGMVSHAPNPSASPRALSEFSAHVMCSRNGTIGSRCFHGSSSDL